MSVGSTCVGSKWNGFSWVMWYNFSLCVTRSSNVYSAKLWLTSRIGPRHSVCMRVSGGVLCWTSTNVSTPNCVTLEGCCALCKSSDSLSRRATLTFYQLTVWVSRNLNQFHLAEGGCSRRGRSRCHRWVVLETLSSGHLRLNLVFFVQTVIFPRSFP